jgi:hypothetical protein
MSRDEQVESAGEVVELGTVTAVSARRSGFGEAAHAAVSQVHGQRQQGFQQAVAQKPMYNRSVELGLSWIRTLGGGWIWEAPFGAPSCVRQFKQHHPQ